MKNGEIVFRQYCTIKEYLIKEIKLKESIQKEEKLFFNLIKAKRWNVFDNIVTEILFNPSLCRGLTLAQSDIIGLCS